MAHAPDDLQPSPPVASRSSGALGVAPLPRGAIRAEIWIVLGLSLGMSAVYSIVSLIARLTAETPLGEQSTTLNPSYSPRTYLDLTYQVLSIGFALVPVALALYLLYRTGRHPFASIGLDMARPLRDTGYGFLLAAAIGIPGIGLYIAGRALGITVSVQAAALNDVWWALPILVLAAVQNAIVEEVIVVAYLAERLGDLRWRIGAIIAASAVLRGTYHLYQGIGPFVGNAVMGAVFAGFYFSRWGKRRVLPLVIAHSLLDIVAFVGYTVIPSDWLRALGIS